MRCYWQARAKYTSKMYRSDTDARIWIICRFHRRKHTYWCFYITGNTEEVLYRIIEIYSDEYLRPPTADECDAIMAENAERGFPGMIASIDCMHWRWNKCPVAWKGQYQGKEGKASLVLEACATYDTYVWHSFFGSPGTLNDLNILDRSTLVNDIVEVRFTLSLP